MAENQEDRSREDLTEEASPYKIEEMRRKGQVAQSRELTGLLALLATAATFYVVSPKMGAEMAEYMREIFRTDLSGKLDLSDSAVLKETLVKALKLTAMIALPVCLAGFIVGALASFSQIGSIFSTEPVTPDLSKIDPIKGMQKFLTMKQLIEGIRMTIKITIVSIVGYLLIKAQILESPGHILTEPAALFSAYSQSGKVIFLTLFGIMLVFAGVDFWLQRLEYSKNVRMTKQEAKQEFKEREGDPQIKARIRAVQREMARRRMMQAVKKADVIVTNPTHIAVALVYDKEKMAAPRVVAKGADFLAQRIKKIAAEAGVPLVENVPLARTLYKTVKVGHGIPRALYQAVAEVLAYVYRLRNKRF